MHDAAFLHIRSRDGRATRIVSLTEPSVRIGRGRSCEVRLDDPALAEVECLLRRRGDAWHLQPVSPSGRLTLDGRPADRPRPLPFGATLRMADRWLTLLPTMDAPEPDAEAPPEPGSGPAILDVSDPEPSLIPELEPVPSTSDDTPHNSFDSAHERMSAEADIESSADPLESRKAELARLESRLRQRERWLKDRLHERQWEARWRAAGASLKSRGRASDPPEPRPRSTTPPPRPTISPGPSIKQRREVVPPTGSRFDRPTPGDPPSYRVPADRIPTDRVPTDRVPTTPPIAPEMAPTPSEPPIGRGLRVGPAEARTVREPFRTSPRVEPEPIPTPPIEAPVALADPDPTPTIAVAPPEPDPISGEPVGPPVALVDPSDEPRRGRTTELVESTDRPDLESEIESTDLADAGPENEHSAPEAAAIAEARSFAPPIGRIGTEDAEPEAGESDEPDLLGSLAEEFARSFDPVSTEDRSTDLMIIEEPSVVPAITGMADVREIDEPSPEDRPIEPVGLIEDPGTVAPRSPEIEPEPEEAEAVAASPVPESKGSILLDLSVPLGGADDEAVAGGSEEIGSGRAIREELAIAPVEETPDIPPAESAERAEEAPAADEGETSRALRAEAEGDRVEVAPEDEASEAAIRAAVDPAIETVGTRLAIRAESVGDRAEVAPGEDTAEGEDRAELDPAIEPREAGAGADSAAPRRWGMLPTIDLSDLVSFLSRSDRPGSPITEEVASEPVDAPVEDEPVEEEPVEARSVAPPVEVLPPSPVEAGEGQEAAEGFGAGPGSFEVQEHEEFAGVGESVSVRASGEWPSAQAMLGEGTDWERRKRPSSNRISGDLPIPTDRIAPDEWTVPGGAWLCIPLMFVCLAVGVMGVRLSWTWAGIDREAGLLSDQLALGKRPEPGRIERLLEKEEEMPGASWWNSTSDQMIIRAALRSGPGNLYDPASQERAGALLHAASSTAPGHPSLRFAHAWRTLQEPGNDPPSTALGLSRDIWSLAWSGRSLLAEGKLDEAKRAYRSALDMACRARPDPTLLPSFHEEARGGRFGQPLEEVISVVVTDMANRPEWSIEDWEELLPDFAGAWLSGARLLRSREDASAADRLLERAVTLGDSPSPSGCSEAIHEASSAEALALLGRFEEAAERYQEAVDRLSGSDFATTERAWMFNLAELHGRLGNTRRERSCLLASMITDPNEPITSEAIRIQVRKGLSLIGDVEQDNDEQDEAGLAATAASDRNRPSRSLGD